MAAPIKWGQGLRGYIKDGSSCVEDVITVEATTATGFEGAAASEVASKFKLESSEVVRAQGRVLFDIPTEKVAEVLSLRTIDNAWVIIGAETNFDLSGSAEDCLTRLSDSINQLLWKKGLGVWSKISSFKGDVFSAQTAHKRAKMEKEGEDHEDRGNSESPTPIPSFRCTCYRSGDSHPFGSMDAARSIGGAIQDKFKWDVKMKGFDIEVVVNIDLTQVYFGITLTKASLYKRTIRHFGPTTLRSTICSSLLTLAEVKTGDVVVDPMCGGGSIPLEGALGYHQGFHLSGDIHEKAWQRARDNFADVKKEDLEGEGKSLNMDLVCWDATRIPLRDNSVDVFITDLPFGKRSGSKADNRVLYPRTLLSMARVVRPKTGRAVLLTQDKTSMFKIMGKISPYWKTTRQLYCNIGGLAALVFIMSRTDKEVATATNT